MNKIKKYKDAMLFFILILFAVLFYESKAYWQTFLTLGLLVITMRIYDVRKFIVSPKGITAEFRETTSKVSKIIKSDKTPEEKIKETQKLIDEVFRLGYKSGGGKIFGDINNVRIVRNNKGEVTGVQYDEIP